MYDGHSDPKQFLMSYKATISSYGGSQERRSDVVFFPSLGNDHVMEKAEGYVGNQLSGFLDESSNCPSSVPVHVDHEEYMQAYVRRFLRLRAQAPTVPTEIVIKAMIKGLRPGPTT
jgi:hypothetical protein